MKQEDIELILRASAREYLGLREGKYWDSGIAKYQAEKLWFLLEDIIEKAWAYDELCD